LETMEKVCEEWLAPHDRTSQWRPTRDKRRSPGFLPSEQLLRCSGWLLGPPPPACLSQLFEDQPQG
jgi:hypothetical protein